MSNLSTLAPTPPATRIHAIDAVRGLALLGIFTVNIQSFAEPFGRFILPHPGPNESALDAAGFYVVKAFCESKFYPLFSMLFGMGMALQWQRAREAGRPFFGTGVRRQLVLLAIGLSHAVLLWYGDVLFLYSIAGMILLPLLRAGPRTLLMVGGAVLMVTVVLTTGLGVLMALSPQPGDSTPTEFPRYDDPFGAFLKGFEGKEMEQGPSSPLWLGTETQAYREGPYDQVLKFRLVSWAMMLVFSSLSFGWHLLSMFCFGAALLKLGIFSPEGARLRRRLLLIGLLIGLPLSVFAVALPALGKPGMIAAGPLTILAGPLLSLAYLTGIAILAERGRALWLTRSLSNVGRLALTNYLLQSIIATTIFYYYGFGLFGQTTRSERLVFVLAVFLAQVGFSAAWLRLFSFGPAEWLWRSATYLRLQPFRRAAETSASP